jgi:hypothetical protein
MTLLNIIHDIRWQKYLDEFFSSSSVTTERNFRKSYWIGFQHDVRRNVLTKLKMR